MFVSHDGELGKLNQMIRLKRLFFMMNLGTTETEAISHAGLAMMATYDVRLVILSVVIGVLASYTALDLAGRVTEAQGRARQLWFFCGAITMGIGIWSMHFIGMLAYHLPVSVNYNPATVLVSLVVAIVASGTALFVVSRQRMGWLQFLAGGIFMGLGVAAMHYTGMAAMHQEAIAQYDPKLVTLSVVIAVSASLAALGLAFYFRIDRGMAASLGSTQGRGNLPKIGSAFLMGNAIAGMHYTGMAAVSFKPTGQLVLQPLQPMNTTLWAVAIGIATFTILSLTLLTSLFDQRVNAENARAKALRASHNELEIQVDGRTAELAQTNEQLRNAEAEIRDALSKEKELSELKSRFVSTTSHEFRTPLTTILSSAELLEHYSLKFGEEKKLVHLQRIQTAVKQMTALLDDVLLVGQAEAGKLEFNLAPLDVAQFCRGMVDEMQLSSTYSQDGCPAPKIIFTSQGNCTHSHLDEKLLRHILSNLLSNAIKYSPQGGTVGFDLVCNQEAAIFQVRDEGIGIPEAEQAQLFNSFHRASNVGTISGTGLGLAIVKKSVDLHNGEITVKSEVGVGTTFVVVLPLNKFEVCLLSSA